MSAIPAIPPHDTAVIDEPWDAGENVDKIKTPLSTGVVNDEWAWKESGDVTEKAQVKFPHHQVDDNGKPGAANANACRNALARVGNSDIPDADKDGVKRHVQHHLDALDRSKSAARAEALAAEVLAMAESTTGEPLAEGEMFAPHTAGDDIGGSVTPQTGVISAGYSDIDALRAETAPFEMILGKPWAITRAAAVEVATRLAMHTQAGAISADAILAQAEAAARRPVARRAASDGSEIAVIPLRGTITPRGSLFSMLFGGGGGLQAFREQFRMAVADGNCSAIVLDIDSPGGLIDLVPETAAEVFKARGSKPIVAVANTCTASAAYWIASQADTIVSTPSGMVGSIGVFTIHEDFSKMEAMMGIKTTLISAGDHKTDGNPYEPLSKGALASIQNEVDELYDMFTGQVAEGRGISQKAVQAGYGQGRCLLSQQAFTVGMVDRVETLEQTVARLGGGTKDPVAQAADVMQVGDGDEDDGITAEVADLNAIVAEGDERMNELVASLAAKNDPGEPTVDYLNGRAQSPWAL